MEWMNYLNFLFRLSSTDWFGISTGKSVCVAGTLAQPRTFLSTVASEKARSLFNKSLLIDL